MTPNRMRWPVSLLLLAFLHTALSAGAASEITLMPLTERFARLAEQGTPAIVNGKPADPGAYPVSFQIEIRPDLVCTWFYVGPNALVGAAHCLDDANTKIRIESNGSTYSGTCDSPIGYPDDPSLDILLCNMQPAFVIPSGPDIPVSGYEILNKDPAKIAQDTAIEVSGFGCTADGGVVSSVYQIGTARVAEVPPNVHIAGIPVRAPNAIKIRGAPALLCGGDSGGPAMIYPQGGRIRRVVVGTNQSTVIPMGASYLVSTSTTPILKFVSQWQMRTGAKICGIDTDAIGCRPQPK